MTTSNALDIHATSASWEQRLKCTLSEINHKLNDLIYKEQVNQLWKREMESTVRNIRADVCSQHATVSFSCQTDEQLAKVYDCSISHNAVSDPSVRSAGVTCVELDGERDDNEHSSEVKEADIESPCVPSFSVVENDSSLPVVAYAYVEEHSESYTISRSESVEFYQCAHCEATFSRNDEFLRHQQSRSHWKNIKGPPTCQLCLQVFKNHQGLSRHISLRTCQGKEKSNYDCSKCGNSFDTLSKLRYHRLCRHGGEKKRLCILCGKAFYHPAQLSTHMRIHTGEKPYSCTFCSKRFSCESNRRRHVQVHHFE